MKRFLKWFLVIVAVLAAGIAIVIYNPNLARGIIEHQVYRLSGYSLDLRGDLDITLGRSTVLSVENISIGGPEWSEFSELVHVGSIVVKLNGASVFGPTVVVEELLVEGLEINLEVNASGEGNWLGDRRTADDPDGNKQIAAWLEHARITNATIRYLNPSRGVPQVLRITSLQHRRRPDGMLAVEIEASFNDRPVNFDGTAGPYENLRLGQEVAFEGSGRFGSVDIYGKAFIDDLRNPHQPRFEMVMQGADIDEITAMLDVYDLGSGGFNLRALGGVVNDRYEAGFNGQVGDVSLNLSLATSDLASLADLDLEMAANGPNLGAFTRALGVSNWPDSPFKFKGSAQRRGNTLNVSTLTLDIGGSRMAADALLSSFPGLDASRVKLNIAGDDIGQFRALLGLRGIASGPFELTGRLDVSPQEVELVEVELTTSLGLMKLSGVIGDAPDYLDSQFHLHLEGTDANYLMKALGIDALPAKPFSLDTRVRKTSGGLELERGVLVTIENERLELDGFVSLQANSEDTDLGLKVHGQHLGRAMGRVVGGVEFSDLPYRLSGRVRVKDGAILFDDFEAGFADVILTSEGSIHLSRNTANDRLEFQWQGDDFKSLGNLIEPGLPMDVFVSGQSYLANVLLERSAEGWRVSLPRGHIGDTVINAAGLVSNREALDGSYLEFSFGGPDLHSLVVNQNLSDAPPGAFESSGRVLLRGGRLVFDDFLFKATGIHVELGLDMNIPSGGDADTHFNFSLRGEDLRHVFPANDWFEPARVAYNLDVAGSVRGHSLSLQRCNLDVATLGVSLEGSIGGTPGNTDTNIRFNAASDDISRLGQFRTLVLPAVPLNLQAELSGNIRHLLVRDIQGHLGDSDFTGGMEIGLQGPNPSFAVDMRSRLIDSRPFFAHEKPDKSDGRATTDGRVIPDLPLPLDKLGIADIQVSLVIDELKMPKNTLRDILFDGGVNSGVLLVERFAWSGINGGSTNGTFSVTPVPGGAAMVRFDADARGLVFGYSGLTRGQQHTTPAVDIGIHTEGYGNDLRALAASMNGGISVFSTGGVLEDVQLSLLDTFILDEVFKMIQSKQDDEKQDLNLSCAAAVFEISDGVVDTQPAIALTTDKIHLAAKGEINLKKETLKYNFTVTPRNVLKVSATEILNPYILVSGTLAEPQVGIDPSRALIHGGAAVGTAGVSILAKAVIDRVGSTTPLCQKMLEQHQAQ